MPEVEYETADVQPRAVVKAAVGMAVMMAFAAAVTLGVFLLLRGLERRDDPPVPALAQHEQGRLPPAPRLQRLPLADLEQMLAEDRDRLTKYGWVDEQAGVVRIPIEEAMKIYAARQAAQPAVSPSGAVR